MMQQSRLSIVVVGLLCSGAGLRAQAAVVASDVAPLIGSWTLDEAKTSAATEPERRVITAGEGWMRVEVYRPSDDRPPTLVYNLDGSRKVNPFGASTATTEIRRDGADLVTVTVFTVNERPVTVQERLRITDGGELTVAVVLRIEHGYEGVVPPLEKRPANVSETVKYFHKSAPATP